MTNRPIWTRSSEKGFRDCRLRGFLDQVHTSGTPLSQRIGGRGQSRCWWTDGFFGRSASASSRLTPPQEEPVGIFAGRRGTAELSRAATTEALRAPSVAARPCLLEHLPCLVTHMNILGDILDEATGSARVRFLDEATGGEIIVDARQSWS